MFQKFLLGKKLPKYSDQAYLPAEAITKTKIIRKSDHFDVFSFLYGKGSLTIKDLKKVNSDLKENKSRGRFTRTAIWEEILRRRGIEHLRFDMKYPHLSHHIFESDQFITLIILNCCRNCYEGNENEIFCVYQDIIKHIIAHHKEEHRSASENDLENTEVKEAIKKPSSNADQVSSMISSRSSKDVTSTCSNQNLSIPNKRKPSCKTDISSSSNKPTISDVVHKSTKSNSADNSAEALTESSNTLDHDNYQNVSIDNKNLTSDSSISDKNFAENLIKNDEIQQPHQLSTVDKQFLRSLIHLIIFLHQNITKKRESLVNMIVFFLSKDICEQIEIRSSKIRHDQVTTNSSFLEIDPSPRLLPLLDCIIFYDMPLSEYLKVLLSQTHHSRNINNQREFEELIEWLCDKSLVYDTKGLLPKSIDASSHSSEPATETSSQQYFDFLVLEQQLIEAQLHLKQTFLEEIDCLKKQNEAIKRDNEKLKRENEELRIYKEQSSQAANKKPKR